MTSTMERLDFRKIRSASDLPDHYVDESVHSLRSFSFNIWFLTIDADVDISVPRVDLRASILGVTIAHVHLDPQNTTASIGGSVAGFKAVVDLELLTNPVRLVLKAELCAPIVGCKEYQHEFDL